jgi:hypothetical protein
MIRNNKHKTYRHAFALAFSALILLFLAVFLFHHVSVIKRKSRHDQNKIAQQKKQEKESEQNKPYIKSINIIYRKEHRHYLKLTPLSVKKEILALSIEHHEKITRLRKRAGKKELNFYLHYSNNGADFFSFVQSLLLIYPFIKIKTINLKTHQLFLSLDRRA